MTASSQLRVLTINEDENREDVLFRLEKGWTLHFILGPSLTDKHVRIFVNHPSEAKSGPNRQKYRELVWENLSSCKADVYDNFAEVQMVLAGSFNYFFTISGSDKESETNGSGYFLVDPVLRCGRFDERIPLDGICCQTVLAKSLGPFSEWEDRLRVAKEVGYNMIHMTPIQELGLSNSSYCIKDQLKLNSAFCEPGKKCGLSDVQVLVDKMCKEWEVLSLTDLVFNHTANESTWLTAHPECAYNLVNSPHLKPAYLLDRILWKFSGEIANGIWSSKGLPAEIFTEEHLKILREILANDLVPKYQIHEYFLIHVDETVALFKNKLISKVKKQHAVQPVSTLKLILDPQYRRLKASVDMQQAVHLFDVNHPHIYDEEERVKRCCSELKHKLEDLNHHMYEEVQSHLEAAINNVVANTRYRFVDPDGPRIPKVLVDDEPIMWNYFTLPNESLSVKEEETRMHTEWGAHCMAHNGWVMGDDPLRDFAAPGSNVFLRRELIPWGDNVKLRYGNGPKDCPYLWEHMANYVRETARIFHGVRLDNCHSTPIHVAEYMLDEGRKVRADLYVIAELFTSSEHLDNVFINRLGLNSLVREGLNAHDPHDLGHLVHRYGGGSPVGAFFQPPARPLMPSMAHAMLLDQTHDNPSPIEKRSAFDLFPSSALIGMACCATGSNRGYDEMVPHHINVVKETRLYTKWSDLNTSEIGYTSSSCGINAAKKVLNKLHQALATKGFTQAYVDQIKGDVVAVTRHNPISHQSVILAARTAFSKSLSSQTDPFILTAPGIIDEILFEGKALSKDNLPEFKKDVKYINGIQNYVLSMQENITVNQSEMVEASTQSSSQFAQEVEFVSFPPGSVIAFKVSLHHNVKKDVLAIRQTLSQFGYRMRTLSARHVSELSTTELENLIMKLQHNDFNRVLYRCDGEEKDDGKGFGTYNIPGHGDLPYCGLHGIMSVLRNTRAGNDLGHPLCSNIRNGDWLCEYIANRLKAFPSTEGLGLWFERVFSHLIKIPRYLIPCYFDAIVTGVYLLVEEVAWAKMSKFVSTGSTFVRTLAMGSLQLCSVIPTAKLPTLSPHLAPPTPPQAVNQQTGLSQQACLSLAAGLPHFASGIWRSWGRDTFISLRGLLLLTGRYEESRLSILAYAGCLRHGLIPNLLAEGIHARYNCRDAVWWWLYCIQQYCHIVPNGTKILTDKVSRLYPTDEPHPQSPGACDMALHEVIQEALQKHATGICYREHNAGPGIDSDMSDPGFNIECGIDWTTGFVYGGNAHNCGTWMDKMGSSEKAGNKGLPATPRDGSAVELVGLCKATVRWLADIYRQGIYPYEGVTISRDGKTKTTTFQQWNQLILTNFEKHFWVKCKPDKDPEYRADLINKRGIYKDSVGSSTPWTDFQLRPNVPLSMVVAPEMFTPSNAWSALENTGKHLLGPLGMKTLDPSDWAYHGDYDNGNDSHDKKLAKGWNYHQGPEWVWLTGFFLRAKLYFASVLETSQPGTVQETMDFVRNTLSRHNVHIQSSAWQSLPELTNSNGQFCRDSCEAQAWSVATILEVLYDLENI